MTEVWSEDDKKKDDVVCSDWPVSMTKIETACDWFLSTQLR